VCAGEAGAPRAGTPHRPRLHEHGDDDVAKAAAVIIVKSGDERDGHADDAVEVAVFRAFLTREAGEREDEEDGGDDVGRCDDSVVHGGALN